MNTPERRAAILRYATLVVAGLYPFAIAYGNFAGIEPLDHLAVWRAVAASCVITLLLYGISRLFIRDADARAFWLSLFLIICGAYALILALAGTLGFELKAPSRPTAFVFVLLALAITAAATRPWQQRRRDLVPLALVAVTLVGINLYRGAGRLWSSPASQWASAADKIAGAARSASGPTAAPRDIYYIVLDGFGRADTLQQDYGLDVQDFVAFLESRGFYVPQHARSNYAHSYLSFSSFLNLDYLDPLGTAMGKENTSWLPLAELIQRNALMRLARESGLQVTAIGSDYGPTKRFRQADVCHCEQRGLDLFEQVAIGMTPLIALPLDRWTYDAHRDKVLQVFSRLEQLPASPSPRLIVAHILAPHPPFTFAADGSPRRPDRAFMFSDGDDFRGPKEEYVQGYRDQTEFMIRRLRQVVEAILSRPGPAPAIVIHGDHGPGAMLKLNDVTKSDLAERMNIFAAYYLPDVADRFYPSITPVNGSRILANAYLGTNLPLLPDVSWFSTGEHPYDFTRVPPEPGSGGK